MVINGTNNSTVTVTVGTTPRAVAVNPATNKIYVANGGVNTVTVIETGRTTRPQALRLVQLRVPSRSIRRRIRFMSVIESMSTT